MVFLDGQVVFLISVRNILNDVECISVLIDFVLTTDTVLPVEIITQVCPPMVWHP